MRPPMRSGRMIASRERVRNLPALDFVNPPLPGLNIQQVCQRPLEIYMKRSDVNSQQFSIVSVSFTQSSLSDFLTQFSNTNQIAVADIHVHVVGEAGVGAVLRLNTDRDFHNFSCEDESWHQFCTANNLKEGDKVALWLFTRNDAVGQLWLAILVTQRRLFRSIGRI